MTSKSKDGKEIGATLKIRYIRSAIGSPEKHKLVIRSLGFKRLNQVVTRVDTPAIRGMVAQVPHLVEIVSE